MNPFDGVLTIIGVLMGNLMARVDEPRIVVGTGMATCTAMGISGLWGAYLTESAERRRDLAELGPYTLIDLNDTIFGCALRTAVVVVAVIDGLSPFVAALVVLLPFFAAGFLPAITWAYCSSLGVAILTLLGLGFFLGRVSEGSMVGYGVKTVIAGVICVVISLLLGGWACPAASRRSPWRRGQQGIAVYDESAEASQRMSRERWNRPNLGGTIRASRMVQVSHQR
jgi:predicted membrane protein (TIGR00267 family)